MHSSEQQRDATPPGAGPSGQPRSRRGVTVWGAGGLLAALLLLGAFYLVLEQAMQRARAHWTSPPQPGVSACDAAQGRNLEGACEASAPLR